jgi:hypothetical protein
MDWLTGVMGIIGVVVGAGIQEFRLWRERKDRYKDMVFEKRLEAHQGAYYWCKKLLGVTMPHKLMKEGGLKTVNEKLGEATEWLDKNTLYLDRKSVLGVSDFFLYVGRTSLKYKDEKGRSGVNIKEETRRLAESWWAVSSSLQKGMGVEYLPKQEISVDRIEMEKEFDEAVGYVEELAGKQ